MKMSRLYSTPVANRNSEISHFCLWHSNMKIVINQKRENIDQFVAIWISPIAPPSLAALRIVMIGFRRLSSWTVPAISGQPLFFLTNPDQPLLIIDRFVTLDLIVHGTNSWLCMWKVQFLNVNINWIPRLILFDCM